VQVTLSEAPSCFLSLDSAVGWWLTPGDDVPFRLLQLFGIVWDCFKPKCFKLFGIVGGCCWSLCSLVSHAVC
jgi:hypothetical protein